MNNVSENKDQELSNFTFFIIALAVATLSYVLFVISGCSILGFSYEEVLISRPPDANSPFMTFIDLGGLALSVMWGAVGCRWALKNMINLHADMPEMRDAHSDKPERSNHDRDVH